MGGIVIADQVKLSIRRDGLVDQAEKLEPFLVAMPLLAQAKDFAVGRIQRGKQSGRAVSFVVVRHGGAASALQRQAGLGTIQSLNLALLVGAQHQRVFGRIEIQADDVFQFLREGRIVADLESFHAMRFQPVGAPDAPHAGFADADRRRHGTSAPMSWVAGAWSWSPHVWSGGHRWWACVPAGARLSATRPRPAPGNACASGKLFSA